MVSYPISPNEEERLQELFSYKILDTPAEEEFEDLVRIAVNLFNVPAAAITFIDANRQWMKASHGFDVCELNRELSVGNYTLMQNQVFEIENLQQDERFKHLTYIAGAPCYRFYAGVPLITINGIKIGVFCILDTKIRRLNEEQRQMLVALSRQSMRRVELRLSNQQPGNQGVQPKQILGMSSHGVNSLLSEIKTMLDKNNSNKDLLPVDEHYSNNHLPVEGVDATKDMIDKKKTWGKLQLQNNENKVKLANLRQLAFEAIKEAAPESRNKRNIIVNAIPANVNTYVDCGSINFALINLLANANKFTAQGCITISHEYTDGKHYIHVADTGAGMSKEQTDKFNLNKQINTSVGTNNEMTYGLGVGLSHNYLATGEGRLLFQSEVGKGTKASFVV